MKESVVVWGARLIGFAEYPKVHLESYLRDDGSSWFMAGPKSPPAFSPSPPLNAPNHLYTVGYIVDFVVDILRW
jgi:hypothetical protein